MNSPGPEWRYERKFLVADQSPEEILGVVRRHPAHFQRAHPARTVNNLYLDSHDRRSFADTVDGMPDRAKFRVRWYGASRGAIEAPVLEVKIKRGMVGHKQSFPLPAFVLSRDLRLDDLRQEIIATELPPALRERISGLRLALMNHYRREYWRSSDGLLRLTLDTDLQHLEVHGGRNHFLRRQRDRDGTVLELKYAVADDDRGRWAASRLPFRMTKSSKYVRGVESLGLARSR